MIKTKVVWSYDADTLSTEKPELINLNLSEEDQADKLRSELYNVLNAKATELSGAFDSSSTLEIEFVDGKVANIRTRSWPDLATAQEWVTFVLSKGAESAVVVEE